jgi:hypothetical protein
MPNSPSNEAPQPGPTTNEEESSGAEAAEPTATANSPTSSTRRFLGLSGASIAIVSSLVVGVGTAVVAILAVLPNLASSTTNQATLSNIYIEQRVSLGVYLHDLPVKLSLEHDRAAQAGIDRFVNQHPASQQDLGAVVHFGYQVVGYKGHPLNVRWMAFDAKTGDRLPATSEEFDLLPLRFTAQKRDGDVGSWEIWVNAQISPGQPVFLLIEMYDLGAGTRIGYTVTDKFTLPSQ